MASTPGSWCNRRAMSTPIVTLADVSLRYRIRKSFFRHEYYDALQSINCNLFKGETLGILGRNGSGKSTLLKLIAGIFLPDGGRIETNGASVSLLSLAVGFDPELPGQDNIIISAMLLGASKSEAYESVAEITEFSELDEFIGEPVKTYSSGMRMRLGFAIAMAVKPDVLLIDEVLGVGDAHFRKKAEATIVNKIVSEQTVVLVSHNSKQIEALCDRALWMEGGTIRTEGEPAHVVKVYEEYIGESRGVGGGRRTTKL